MSPEDHDRSGFPLHPDTRCARFIPSDRGLSAAGIADQADESYTVAACPGEVVHLADGQPRPAKDDENR